MKKGTRLEFYFILLGGLINIFFSITLFSPVLFRQLWAVYYLVSGVALISLSFRISNRRNHTRDSWFVILLGAFSLNPYLFIVMDFASFNPLPLIGGIIALIKSPSSSKSPSPAQGPSIPSRPSTLPPPRFMPKNRVVLTPAYTSHQRPSINPRRPLSPHPMFRIPYTPKVNVVKR